MLFVDADRHAGQFNLGIRGQLRLLEVMLNRKNAVFGVLPLVFPLPAPPGRARSR